jgi:hypothetical protein
MHDDDDDIYFLTSFSFLWNFLKKNILYILQSIMHSNFFLWRNCSINSRLCVLLGLHTLTGIPIGVARWICWLISGPSFIRTT